MAVIAIWLGYRSFVARDLEAPMPVMPFCEEGRAAARLPGGGVIRCRAWDIGRGVTGYAWEAPNARGAVLLQHGYGDYAFRYIDGNAALIPHLLNLGYSVYAFDMYGNGHSPGRRGLVDPWQAVDDHLAARARLKDTGLPLFLIGHSLGGLVTATSAARDPDGIAGMILLAPALLYDVGPVARSVARLGGMLLPTFPAPLPEPEPGTLSRDAAFESALREDPLMWFGPLPWVTAAGGAALSDQNFALYPRITAPVLAIHGTVDLSTDPRGSARFVDAVTSPEKRLMRVPGARHALLDDDDAIPIRQRILNWIDNHTPSGGHVSSARPALSASSAR